MLFAEDGRQVLALPDPPAGVVDGLRAVHPLLGLRYLPFHRQWWLTWTWDENDPRRKKLQEGRVSPADAHTLIAPLPDDCALDEAVSFARRSLIINPPAKMWEAVAARVEQTNEDQEQAVMDAALADVQNRIEVTQRSLKMHFEEGVEQTDVHCEYDVEAPTAEEVRAARNGGVFE